ncbi:MAG: T9SS C-terminal target domain-containing protein [Marinilabiliales bacterium]|nr:MAG: T9SS C-terminal target domain-containing protein [Marinilabiliales bacterium]
MGRRLYPAISLLLLLHLVTGAHGQVVTADRNFPRQTDGIVITFHADRGDGGLMGFDGDVYAHTGVITAESTGPSDWKFVKTSWGQNTAATKLDRVSEDKYRLTISPDINGYYGITGEAEVLQLAFVFRSANNSRIGRDAGGADIFLQIYGEGLHARIISPDISPLIVSEGETVGIEVAASEQCNLSIFINDDEVLSDFSTELSWQHNADETGQHWIWVRADDGSSVVYDSVYYFAKGDVPVAELPKGALPGVNYIDDHTAVVVLHDPPGLKEHVFLTGDFNDWELREEWYMNRTPAGTHYWVTLSDLEPGREYGYQFLIDGELRIADPYTHKVLDPWHDKYIPETTYPGLKPYPEGKTTGIVSVLQTAREEYQWESTAFELPDISDLVIYELLIRDFVGTSSINTVKDTLDYLQRLGVNAIQLMPVNEFEGNDSWGYNPSFYFATDKAYGTREDYKRFIDECHKRGIAVILDMVLNHSFSQSPLVQMYFDPGAGQYGQPTEDNPWYNEVCPHPPWCWGYDFDHESPYTREFVDRVNRYWLEEFRFDGFRFDFTKGFTNNQTANQGAAYDASRIAILKRMADRIWEVNEDALVILEHFTENSEETVLAEYGMLLWGNMNYNYNEATMGYTAGSNLTGASYRSRGWDVPHLIAYMESHDEERLMYKNLQWGNSSGGYDTSRKGTALRRMELAATFYFTIPGPKMIWQFGELGYDYSINHCPDGTISEDCRTARKPVRWDYYDDWQRRRLFDVYSMLIDLKKTQPVFGTGDFETRLSGAMKSIHLNHEENRVAVLGNFGVTPGDINPRFQQPGTWYEFFSGGEIEVDDTEAPLTLQPGEYRLYSTVEFPPHGIPLSSPAVEPANSFDASIYPNPSREGVHIKLNQEIKGDVSVRVYDVSGRLVSVLLNQELAPGFYEVSWDRSTVTGARAGNGVYIVRVGSGTQVWSDRVILF